MRRWKSAQLQALSDGLRSSFRSVGNLRFALHTAGRYFSMDMRDIFKKFRQVTESIDGNSLEPL
jgi:hypothetical protein